LRLYLGCHHYREIWSHEESVLERAEELARKLYSATTAAQGEKTAVDPESALDAFRRAMNQDLDTPSALGEMEKLADEILEASAAGRAVGKAQDALRSMGKVFGLQLDTGVAEERVLTGWQRHITRFTSAEA